MSTPTRNLLFPYYEQLAPFVADLIVLPVDKADANIHLAASVASLAKCFEFNYSICSKDISEYSFFFIPFLRGMCEDLITLRYLTKYDAAIRQRILHNYLVHLQIESIHAQELFFKAEFIFEPLIKLVQGPHLDSFKTELKNIWSSFGFKKERIFPSVEQMAIETKMKILYQYLYHATSRAVHFSPNVLMRMGWAKDKEYIFTTKNFTSYYNDFVMFYGTYLFLKFIKEFKKELNIDKEFLKICKAMKAEFIHLPSCPEIVTFEEMNDPRPISIVALFADKSLRFKDSI